MVPKTFDVEKFEPFFFSVTNMKSFLIAIGVSTAFLAQGGLCAAVLDKNATSFADVTEKPVQKSVLYGPFTVAGATSGKGAASSYIRTQGRYDGFINFFLVAMPMKSNINLPYVSARLI
jgi:hypothetical protein